MSRTKHNKKPGGGPNNVKSKKNQDKVHQTESNKKNVAIRPLKDRLRDIQRKLHKSPNLPADLRQSYEREIQALNHELVNMLVDKERHEMIGKYHMVRFFERQKSMRILRKASKALEKCEDDSKREQLTKQEWMAQVQHNYTIYYPYMIKYHSLWAKTTDKDKRTSNEQTVLEEGTRGNPAVWRRVAQATKDGTLDKLKDEVPEEKMVQIRQSLGSSKKVGTEGEKDTVDRAEQDEDAEIDDEKVLGFFE